MGFGSLGNLWFMRLVENLHEEHSVQVYTKVGKRFMIHKKIGALFFYLHVSNYELAPTKLDAGSPPFPPSPSPFP
jgi:hypothetical protein